LPETNATATIKKDKLKIPNSRNYDTQVSSHFIQQFTTVQSTLTINRTVRKG